MVVPVGAGSFAEALRMGADIFHALRGILKSRGQSTGVGDEGGFAPNLKSNHEAIDVVLEADRQDRPESRPRGVLMALDVASSELWAGGGRYAFKKSGEAERTSDQMIRALRRLAAPVSDRVDRRRPRRGRLERMEGAHDGNRRRASSWWETTCS